MEKEGKDRSVLIAGGFHTRGMKRLLEEAGVSYVVVTPKITKDVETPYIKVLTNQRTSLDDIITESAAMPGTAAVVSQKTESAFLSPLPRAFIAHQFLTDTRPIEKLLALSEGEAEKRLVEFMQESIDLQVEAWITKLQYKFVAARGQEEWKEFIGNENNVEMIRRSLLTKYDNEFDQIIKEKRDAGVDVPAHSNKIKGGIEVLIKKVFKDVMASPVRTEEFYFTDKEFLTLDDVDVKGKIVFLRSDLNSDIVDGKVLKGDRIIESIKNTLKNTLKLVLLKRSRLVTRLIGSSRRLNYDNTLDGSHEPEEHAICHIIHLIRL